MAIQSRLSGASPAFQPQKISWSYKFREELPELWQIQQPPLFPGGYYHEPAVKDIIDPNVRNFDRERKYRPQSDFQRVEGVPKPQENIHPSFKSKILWKIVSYDARPFFITLPPKFRHIIVGKWGWHYCLDGTAPPDDPNKGGFYLEPYVSINHVQLKPTEINGHLGTTAYHQKVEPAKTWAEYERRTRPGFRYYGLVQQPSYGGVGPVCEYPRREDTHPNLVQLGLPGAWNERSDIAAIQHRLRHAHEVPVPVMWACGIQGPIPILPPLFGPHFNFGTHPLVPYLGPPAQNGQVIGDSVAALPAQASKGDGKTDASPSQELKDETPAKKGGPSTKSIVETENTGGSLQGTKDPAAQSDNITLATDHSVQFNSNVDGTSNSAGQSFDNTCTAQVVLPLACLLSTGEQSDKSRSDPKR